ncbi:MAG: hypothetical protein WAM14_02485 [Candidatus Nitrosopolaris sp.]
MAKDTPPLSLSGRHYENVFVVRISSTTLDLFAQEMKYLHDNGFRVLLLNQLGYDPNNNVFYIKSAT